MTTDTIDVATSEHPPWCSRKDCLITEPGANVHLSRLAEVRSPRTDLAVSVQLMQQEPIEGCPDSDQPFVSLVIRFPDYGPDHPAEEYAFCFDQDITSSTARMLAAATRCMAAAS
jgi:hypothetical protein